MKSCFAGARDILVYCKLTSMLACLEKDLDHEQDPEEGLV